MAPQKDQKKMVHNVPSLNKRLVAVEAKIGEVARQFGEVLEESISLAQKVSLLEGQLQGLDALTEAVKIAIAGRENENDLIAQVKELLSRVEALEAVPEEGKPIQHVELHNGETVPEQREQTNRMNERFRLKSIENIIKILPPNYMVKGRHTLQNVSALAGFKVTQGQLDIAYARLNS
jgi:hypothetical protein